MFKAPLDLETIRKAWAVYPKQSKRRVPIVMFLGILGTAFEAFGIGLVIPVMTTMSKATPGNSGSVLQPLFDLFGIRAVGTMVGVAVLSIVVAFMLKNAYQLFLNWYNTKFNNFSTQQMSSMLFRSFLRRPYTFHLQRNSSELLNVIQQEVGMTVGIVGGTTALVKETLFGGLGDEHQNSNRSAQKSFFNQCCCTTNDAYRHTDFLLDHTEQLRRVSL